MSSNTDMQVAGIAAGFTLGFGAWTVSSALEQTKRAKNPRRSIYIIMVWGEIFVNLAMCIIAWLFLNDVIKPSVPSFFFMLFLWTFEIQLNMQIIINRVAIVAETQRDVKRVKWGVAALITCVNIAVFCIWIPARLEVSERYIRINTIWDRCSKIIILLVDVALNLYFIKLVKKRLLSFGLMKYAPLVRFNMRLMVISIAMNAILIGLMSLKNGAVYIQFHPVAYLVKLQIELSMATLIAKLARGRTEFELSGSHNQSSPSQTLPSQRRKSQPHVSTQQPPSTWHLANGTTPGISKEIDTGASVCSKTDLIVETQRVSDTDSC